MLIRLIPAGIALQNYNSDLCFKTDKKTWEGNSRGDNAVRLVWRTADKRGNEATVL